MRLSSRLFCFFSPTRNKGVLSYLALAALLLALPMFFRTGTALNLINQICIASIFALSFNLLLGQTGLLSFGHAVYSGLGGFVAIHAMRQISAGTLSMPTSLVPLVAGFAGIFFGLFFGFISSKKSGISFSMISLGLGELVFASALMFPGFFGGEGGVSANRVSGVAYLGISFGPQIQVSYLIIIWTLLCILAMMFFIRTPLCKLANALRDNSERLAFIGFNPRLIRFLMILISSFFAAVAGGLAAINFEIATAENVGALRSGMVLLFCIIGGVGYFYGPILGAVFVVLMTVVLSEFSPAWQFYTGLFFIAVVLFAPNGLAGLIAMCVIDLVAAYRQQGLCRYLLFIGGVLIAGTVFFSGIVVAVESIYRVRFSSNDAPSLPFFGLDLSLRDWPVWILALALSFLGLLGLISLRSVMKQRQLRSSSQVNQVSSA
ncbi:MAG: branched-chain amino acid ABC transporter permease [Undibacterium sp.]|nr:branched-chain amino acid ABC transporter permease [Undibacterium sp.]